MATKNKKKKISKDVFKVGQLLEGNRIKTPLARLSFPNLFKPESFKGGEPKFKCSLIFDDAKTDLVLLKKLAKKLIKEKYGDNKPKKFKTPWRDGEEREQAGYGEGTTFMNVTSSDRPLLVDKNGEDVIDQSDLYAGCYVRAILIPFIYEDPSKGLSFILLAVQKIKDGEAFGSNAKAEDFGDDDMSNFEDDDDDDEDDDDDDLDDLDDF